MKALVTGGGGRLGNVLVRQLLEVGYQVRVLDLKRGASLEHLEIEFVAGDIREEESVRKAIQGCDEVFHLAAKISLLPDQDQSMYQVNTLGTRMVAKLCHQLGVRRLVHCSSHHALEMRPYTRPVDETRPLALKEKNDYHRSKAWAEVEVLQQVEAGLDAVIVNPGTLVGPYDYEPSIFARALLDLYHGKIPVLMAGLSDYTDVRDVAKAIQTAAQHGRKGERYLLTGWMLSMKELPQLLSKITHKKMPRTVLPLWMMYTALPVIQLQARLQGKPPLFTKAMLRAAQSNPWLSHDKAKKELNYQPRDLETAFRDYFDWFREQGWIKD